MKCFHSSLSVSTQQFPLKAGVAGTLSSMVRGVQQIARSQGMDFLYAVQGWAGYNEDNWPAAGKLGSDEKFSFLFGAEVPKQRFGHTWWLGIDNICHF